MIEQAWVWNKPPDNYAIHIPVSQERDIDIPVAYSDMLFPVDG
jgi:hypothetical protein